MDLPWMDAELQEAAAGVARPFRHAYDVQPGTGRAMSRYPLGWWVRGVLARGDRRPVTLPPVQPMPEPGGIGATMIAKGR